MILIFFFFDICRSRFFFFIFIFKFEEQVFMIDLNFLTILPDSIQIKQIGLDDQVRIWFFCRKCWWQTNNLIIKILKILDRQTNNLIIKILKDI